jgi:hypothetical protein
VHEAPRVDGRKHPFEVVEARAQQRGRHLSVDRRGLDVADEQGRVALVPQVLRDAGAAPQQAVVADLAPHEQGRPPAQQPVAGCPLLQDRGPVGQVVAEKARRAVALVLQDGGRQALQGVPQRKAADRRIQLA